jgi:hypothetical protein
MAWSCRPGPYRPWQFPRERIARNRAPLRSFRSSTASVFLFVAPYARTRLEVNIGLSPESWIDFCNSAIASVYMCFARYPLGKLIMRSRKSRVHINGLTALRYRFVRKTRNKEKFGQIRIDVKGQRIEICRLPHFGKGVVVTTQQGKVPGIPMVCGCIEYRAPSDSLRSRKVPKRTVESPTKEESGITYLLKWR